MFPIQAEQESETKDDVDEATPPRDLSGYVEKFIELRKQLDTEVKGNVCEAQKRQKKHYDTKHQQGSFKVGQSVLVKNMKKLSKKGDKMDPSWTGPYEVADCVGNNNYRLRRREGNKDLLKSIYNSTRLKLFNERGKHYTCTMSANVKMSRLI